MKRILPGLLVMLLPALASAQTFNEEQFNVGNGALLSGTSFSPYVTFEETGCGEVKIVDADPEDGHPFRYKPMVVSARTVCGSGIESIDMSTNLKVTMRVRGKSGLVIGGQLADNASTRLKTERIPYTLTTDWEFETITFEFTSPEVGFTPNDVRFLYLTLDPKSDNEGGWTGDSLYIDYISFGDATGTGNATCKSDVDVFGDGSSTFYVDQFDNVNSVGLGGESSDSLILNQTANCGQISVKNNPENGELGEFKPMVFTVKDTEGSSTTTDITGNEKVIIKAMPVGGSIDLRVDLKASTADNSTNGCAARLTKTFPADVWSTMEYDFQSAHFVDDADGTVDKTDIKGANLFFLGGDGLGDGVDSVVFDFISVGEAPTTLDSRCDGGVGIKDASITALELYPNPVSDIVVINSKESGKLTISNSMGQVMKVVPVQAGENVISLTELEIGSYTAAIRGNQGAIQTNRLMKQ